MGGNAMREYVTPIKQEFVPEVKELVTEVLEEIGVTDFKFVGSAGKKSPNETSGDIDVAMNVPDPQEVLEELTEMGYHTKFLKQHNIVTFAMPYSHGAVQVDLGVYDDVDLAEWAMFTEHYTRTHYKSAIRNCIMREAIIVRTEEVTKTLEDGTPCEWKCLVYESAKGVSLRRYTNIGVRGNILRVKKTISKHQYSMNPQQIVKLVFGIGGKNDVSSAEKCVALLKRSPYFTDEERDYILARTAIYARQFGFKYDPAWERGLELL